MRQTNDLISGERNLKLQENKGKLVIGGLKWVEVKSETDLQEKFNSCIEERETAATALNEVSSRSHLIFMIKIFMSGLKASERKIGKLMLLDLAGSESGGKTGATG